MDIIMMEVIIVFGIAAFLTGVFWLGFRCGKKYEASFYFDRDRMSGEYD